MITSNVHTADGITNGSIGILRHITCRRVTTTEGLMSVPTIAWIEFPEKRTGALARDAFRGHKPSYILESWTPIGLETKTVVNWGVKHLRVVRTQFPLIPAEAITIHKSQSLTIIQMVLTLHSAISRSLLYTGCSRAKTSDGLWIKGTFIPPKPVQPSNLVWKAYEALRSKPVILSHLPTPATRNGMCSMIFYNVEHLIPHTADIKHLIRTFRPTITALVETHTWPNQDIHIPGYELTHRSDLNAQERSHGYGMAFFGRYDGIILNTCNKFTQGGHVQLTAVSVLDKLIVYGYSSPQATYAMLEEAVTEIFSEVPRRPASTILSGDFNFDLNTSRGSKLRNLMISLGLDSCLPDICSTTKSGTQIDCVFSDVDEIEVHITSTLSSHHEPLFISWPSALSIDEHDLIEELLDLNLGLGENASVEVNSKLGMINPSGKNFCFANAAIQGLCRLHGFLPALRIQCERDTTLSCLSSLSAILLNGLYPGDVTSLMKMFSNHNVIFKGNQQHDTLEFIELLLDEINEDAFLTSTPDAINNAMRIEVSEPESCTRCNHVVENVRSLWSITLELPKNNMKTDIFDLLHAYYQPTTTVPKTCPECHGHNTFLQRTSFIQLPSSLILHLGRFLDGGEKSECLVSAPHELELMMQNGCSKQYLLRAVINHYGSPVAGHYVVSVCCDKTQQWSMYDDERVCPIDKEDVMTKNAYVLFYDS